MAIDNLPLANYFRMKTENMHLFGYSFDFPITTFDYRRVIPMLEIENTPIPSHDSGWLPGFRILVYHNCHDSQVVQPCQTV